MSFVSVNAHFLILFVHNFICGYSPWYTQTHKSSALFLSGTFSKLILPFFEFNIYFYMIPLQLTNSVFVSY